MSEILKKEFTDNSDLQRIRNIIQKKFGDRTKIIAGFEQSEQIKKEGDIWEEHGKEWTIKNGVKVSISSIDNIRDFLKIPLWCPECGGHLKHSADKKIYKIYNHCLDCQIKKETKMKMEGSFEEYEKQVINSNLKSMVSDVEASIKDYLGADANITILTSDGTVEDWAGKENKAKIVEDVQKQTEEIKKQLDE